MSDSRPVVAHAIGCPAGVAPELTARMLADPEVTAAARLIVIGDARVLAKGAATAGVKLDIATISDGARLLAGEAPVLIDLKHLDPATVPVGALAKASGDFAMANFRKALALCRDGVAGSVTFSPFNKASMRLSHPAYEDEVVFLTEFLHFRGVAQEFNILPKLWSRGLGLALPPQPRVSRRNRRSRRPDLAPDLCSHRHLRGG
jgi:4-hydroxythreonine-4-phosphate dehydrogenase